MSTCRRYILSMCATLLLLAAGVAGNAQDLTNEKIKVGASTLTRLKFNSEVTDWDLGSRDNFTCDPRDNRVLIRSLVPNPPSTNLIIFEGKRSHSFVLVFVKDADPNNDKFDYDFSDLKALRARVSKKPGQGDEAAVKESGAEAKSPGKSKKEEAAERDRKAAEQKQIADDLARQQKEQRRQELKQQQELAAAKEAEQKRVAEEQIHRTQEAREAIAAARAKAAEEKKLAAAAKTKAAEEKATAAPKSKSEDVTAKANPATEPEEPKKLSRREERALRKQQEKDAEAAAAKAEEARRQEAVAAAAKEKARQDELERQHAIAAEAVRKQEEALQKKRDAIAAKAAEKETARLKQHELTAAKEAKRKEALQKQKELADARAKEASNSLSYTALRKKYPTINFADMPQGQMYTGDYFRAADTLENYQQCVKMLGEKPDLGISSNTVAGIDMRLESISFSGVNAFLRLQVHNNSAAEYLAGKMLLRWEKMKGAGYNLYACYVTSFPVIPAKGTATIVYVARGVNAKDDDRLYFSLSDRVNEGNTIEIPFSGKLYNKELLRK